MMEWLLYATGVTLLAGLAALATDGLVAARGGPRRLVWLLALAAGIGLGLGGPLLAKAAAPSPAVMAAPTGEPTEAAPAAPPVPAPSMDGRAVRAMDRPLVVAWLLSSALLLAAIAGSAGQLWLIRRSGPVRRLRGLRLVHSSSRGPAAAGLIAPWVVLPRWTRSLPRQHRRFVLAHEVEHVRARDPALKLSGALLVALMPWNVAAWWLLRRLHAAIEFDCDARVVRRLGATGDYARFLIDMASRRHPLPTGAVHLSGNLERRLHAMVTRERSDPHYRLLRTALAAAAVTALVLLRPPAAPAFADTSVQLSAQPGQPANGAAPVGTTDVAEDGSISGMVVDHDGAPLAGVLIRVVDGDIGTVTNRLGQFLIPYLPPGTYRLRVSGPGYRSQVVADVGVTARHRTGLTIVLSRTGQSEVPADRQDPSPHRSPAPDAVSATPRATGDDGLTGSIVGTIVNAAGDAIPAVLVRVEGAQLGTITDVEGRFLLPRLQEGTYRLQVSAPGYAAQAVDDIRIEPGARATLFVTLIQQPPNDP